jgi:hypothetical protein
VFDLLPERQYSRRVILWGIAISLVWIGLGVFEVIRHRSILLPEEGYLKVGIGIVMLLLWFGRRRG